jgi:hypothetical protein
MSDNLPAPIMSSKASAWLPCVSLALTVAAFGLGAPARLARLNLRPSAHAAGLEFDSTIHYEPVIATERAAVLPAGALRGLHELLSHQLIALK